MIGWGCSGDGENIEVNDCGGLVGQPGVGCVFSVCGCAFCACRYRDIGWETDVDFDGFAVEALTAFEGWHLIVSIGGRGGV